MQEEANTVQLLRPSLLCGKWFDACAPFWVDIFTDGFFMMLILKT